MQKTLSLKSIRGSNSGTDMTGRPGYWTMEMIGGSSASYLARTPCVPYFLPWSIGVETEGLLDYQGRAGIISIVQWNLRPVIFGVDNCGPPSTIGLPTSGWIAQASSRRCGGCNGMGGTWGSVTASHKARNAGEFSK